MIFGEEMRLELHGFEPKSTFGSFVKGLLGGLYLEAPSDAVLTASFTKKQNQVSGLIQVRSSQGVFAAEAEGEQAQAVAYDVVEKIRHQLKCWKQERWQDGYKPQAQQRVS